MKIEKWISTTLKYSLMLGSLFHSAIGSSSVGSNHIVLEEQEFCRQVYLGILNNWPKNRDLSAKKVQLQTRQLVAAMLHYQMAPYIPTPIDHPSAQLWNVSQILADVLDVKTLIFIKNPNELRFLPYVMENSHILVIFKPNSQELLDLQKVKKVVNVAKSRGIKIHQFNFTPQTSLHVSLLSEATGGKAIRLFQSKTMDKELCGKIQRTR